MNDGGGHLDLRRFLVAVDASPASLALLESAATLAAGMDAELSGIFVEDINLLRLAGLPFARELAWSSATEVQLDYQRMERVLRGRGAHARRAVISVTTQLKLHGSLQIVRGQIVAELLRAAQGMDLLILGKGGGAMRLGDVARGLAAEAPCRVLLLPEKTCLAGPVLVAYTGQPRDERMLIAAAQFARLDRHGLLVVIPCSSMAEYNRLHDQARQLLGSGSLLVGYQALGAVDMRSYQRLVREEGIGLAVLAGGTEDAADLGDKLAVLDCAVLLVR